MRIGTNVILEKIDDNIGTRSERLTINICLCLLHSYSKFQLNFSINSQQRYIESILWAVDFLYQYYDLEPIYFSLLDHAACTLEKLASSVDNKEMLAEYYDQAAVVFQTAADKTRQGPIYKEIWANKSKEYKVKADVLREVTSDIPHEEKIMQLYESFSESIPHEFIKNLLLDNYRRYKSEHATPEVQFNITGLHHRNHRTLLQEDDEQRPLLRYGIS